MPLGSSRVPIKRFLFSAVVFSLVFYVFVLTSSLPRGSTLETSLNRAELTAKSHLAKELAIKDPQETLYQRLETRRGMQMLKARDFSGASRIAIADHSQPLKIALNEYQDQHSPSQIDKFRGNANIKYIVYTPGVVGWGNRVQGLYLSFAAALLTNRTLLVDWTSPVPVTDLVTLNPNLLILRDHDLPIPRSASVQDYDAWKHPQGYSSFPKDILRNTDLNAKWDADVIMFSAGEDWLDSLLANPHLKDDITRVFGVDPHRILHEKTLQNIAHQLLKFLVVGLSPQAQNFLRDSPMFPRFRDASSIISVQIRIGTNNTSFEPFVDEKEDVPKFWECVTVALKEEPSNSLVFLATDSLSVKKQAIQRFGDKMLFFEGPIVHSGNEQTTDEHGVKRSQIGLLKVVIDWYLLGEGNYMFRSRQSTFGRSAAVRRPTPSLILPSEYTKGCGR